ncbi:MULTISPECIES: DUF6296 family protein [unclassified Streptomyces]|uniref:DUF6296 family protein n=1 Tax=unclassified Streptomyces TaxID=2593676 RepID=UPI002E293261|nr:DUF6296 family protein [Streptomyces sp. NBC_01429]
MGRSDHYELVFSHSGAPAPVTVPGGDVDTVVVHRTDRKGPGGHPLYADDTGIVLAEISDLDEVRMIASGGQQDLTASVAAHPV